MYNCKYCECYLLQCLTQYPFEIQLVLEMEKGYVIDILDMVDLDNSIE